MATLQKIRNRAGLLIGVIGVALLAFILGDLLTSGNTFFRKYQDKAFVVDGDIVSTGEYFDRVTEWEEFQKMISGQSSLDENAISQIRDIVYEQMVKERLLDVQASKLGISVSKEEINDLVHGESISPLLQQLPLFANPETGVFDRDMLVQFITTINTNESVIPANQVGMVRQYKSIWLFLENLIKYQRLEEKYSALLSAAVMPNDVEAKTVFEQSLLSSDIEYAMQNYFTVPDSVANVTDAEMRKYYNENKHHFTTNVPMATITYFTKDIVPSDEDFDEVESRTSEVYERLVSTDNAVTIVSEYSDRPYIDAYVASNLLTAEERSFVESAEISDVYGPFRDGESFKLYKYMDKTIAPDSARIRIIGFPYSMANDSLVTALIDSLHTEIIGGASFADIANSINPQSNGGEVGWVREIDLAQAGPGVAEQVFATSVGSISRLDMPGQRGLVYVDEKTAPVAKYKLAIVNMPVVVSDKTQNNIDNELNQFVSDPKVKSNFVEKARELGYSVVPSYRASASDHMLGRIPSSRQVLSWAFKQKEGAVSKFDLSKSRVIARVDKLIPAGVAPFSEVSDFVKSMLLNDKKADVIIEQLKSQNPSSMNAYAQAMGSQIDTVRFVDFNTQSITKLGSEPIINAYAAYGPQNKVIGPLKGDKGVFVINVINREKSDGEYNAEEQKAQLHSNTVYRMQTEAVNVLKEKMKVVDNRYKFF